MQLNKKSERAYLILGSNMGDRERNIRVAKSLLVTELSSTLVSQIYESSIIESEPWGFEADQKFLNQGIAFDTTCPPELLLEVCKYVEKKMGRDIDDVEYDENGKRIYKSRIIDIDIALYGEHTVDTPKLKIPHPQVEERDYAKKIISELKNL